MNLLPWQSQTQSSKHQSQIALLCSTDMAVTNSEFKNIKFKIQIAVICTIDMAVTNSEFKNIKLKIPNAVHIYIYIYIYILSLGSFQSQIGHCNKQKGIVHNPQQLKPCRSASNLCPAILQVIRAGRFPHRDGFAKQFGCPNLWLGLF